jgi:hypothetical protein
MQEACVPERIGGEDLHQRSDLDEVGTRAGDTEYLYWHLTSIARFQSRRQSNPCIP